MLLAILIINSTLSEDLRKDEKFLRGVNNFFLILFQISVFETYMYVEVCDWFI